MCGSVKKKESLQENVSQGHPQAGPIGLCDPYFFFECFHVFILLV